MNYNNFQQHIPRQPQDPNNADDDRDPFEANDNKSQSSYDWSRDPFEANDDESLSSYDWTKDPFEDDNSFRKKVSDEISLQMNKLDNIKSQIKKKPTQGKGWYYGIPTKTQEDEYKKISLGIPIGPRRQRKYPFSNKKELPNKEKTKPRRSAKVPRRSAKVPHRLKKDPNSVHYYKESALEHNYIDLKEKTELIKKLQDIMGKIQYDTKSSFLEDIKNVIKNVLFKGVSNYNISGDYSKEENNLIKEMKNIMQDIRPYAIIDVFFLEDIKTVIQILNLDKNIILQKSTSQYDPRNRDLDNQHLKPLGYADFINDIRDIQNP